MQVIKVKTLMLVFAALFALSAPAHSASYFAKATKVAKQLEKDFANTRSYDVAARGRLEVAASPDEGGENLVLKVIDSAKSELLVLSYTFNSPTVNTALIRAVGRGVVVRLVADFKNNLVEDRTGKARAALSALKTAGADVRVIRAFQIHHDKVVIADRQAVELGSFNYTSAAAHKNSEIVLVNWDNPELANVLVKHFERNYRLSEEFALRY